jgi:hypothetical protein
VQINATFVDFCAQFEGVSGVVFLKHRLVHSIEKQTESEVKKQKKKIFTILRFFCQTPAKSYGEFCHEAGGRKKGKSRPS